MFNENVYVRREKQIKGCLTTILGSTGTMFTCTTCVGSDWVAVPEIAAHPYMQVLVSQHLYMYMYM